ncbi:MAG: hypothetical protein GX425_07445 [Peptococcaceae bacterium]|nr:hypothetical protein [Peptococcaceae bacterium]
MYSCRHLLPAFLPAGRQGPPARLPDGQVGRTGRTGRTRLPAGREG